MAVHAKRVFLKVSVSTPGEDFPQNICELFVNLHALDGALNFMRVNKMREDGKVCGILLNPGRSVNKFLHSFFWTSKSEALSSLSLDVQFVPTVSLLVIGKFSLHIDFVHILPLWAHVARQPSTMTGNVWLKQSLPLMMKPAHTINCSSSPRGPKSVLNVHVRGFAEKRTQLQCPLRWPVLQVMLMEWEKFSGDKNKPFFRKQTPSFPICLCRG